MKVLFGTLILAFSASAMANVYCKLSYNKPNGEVVSEGKMAYLNGTMNHKFFTRGTPAYSVYIDKTNDNIRVEVTSGEEILLTSWSSFDNVGVMQIQRKETNGIYTLIYCQK